jgi:hypothetical protein
MTLYLACSECFKDQGLKADARQIGANTSIACPQCKSIDGSKLTKDNLSALAYSFYVIGTLRKYNYGAAPIIQFNDNRPSDETFMGSLSDDMKVFETLLGIGFFLYAPRTWMCGEIDPLIDLQNDTKRENIIHRILNEYPELILTAKDKIFRVRKHPDNPTSNEEYDSPPVSFLGTGRLDSPKLPVLYASADLQTCLHECRVAVTDDIYVAKLAPKKEIRLLNLTQIIEEDATEFESLDEAVRFLFLASEHSYPISREIALHAKAAGFDGIAFPSFFSCLRTGTNPIDTAYGISLRRFPELRRYEQAKIVPNIAIFGRPIFDGKLVIEGINKLMLRQTEYTYRFGPSFIPT